jgi:flagellar biosynthesis protein FlhG
MKGNPGEISDNKSGSVPSAEKAKPEDPSKICAFPVRTEAETEQAKAKAKKLNIPFVDPLSANIEADALALLDPDVAKRRQVVPIRLVNDILLVAMASPDEKIAVRSLELLTGYKIRPAAASKSAISETLHRVYKRPERPSKKEAQALAKAKEEAAQKEKRAFTISVISNKGGVGKTHFSINMAYALAKTGARVLLIDADLGSADVSNKIGIFPQNHLMDFLQKEKDMEDLIVSTRWGFDLICGTYGEFKLANLYYTQKVKFIKHFKRVSSKYDFAVLDLGAGIARTVLDFALGADRTVIVTTPQDLISGYACAKASFVRFKEVEQRLEDKVTDYEPNLVFKPLMVINQVSNLAQGAKLFDAVRNTADENVNANEGRFTIKPVYFGSIPYDKENMRATEHKKWPLLANAPYIKASQCIKHMAKQFHDPGKPLNPNVKLKRHPFKRFMAILTQKK